MILELYMLLFITGVLFFILGHEKDAIFYQAMSLVIFLVLTGLSFYITVPFISSTDVVSEHRYIEYAYFAVCPAFVFVDILFMVLNFMHNRKLKRGDIPYLAPGMQ